MARHLRQQFRHHLRIGAVDYQGWIKVASVGPVVFSVVDLPGVTSITRSDVGNFTINLDEACLDVVDFSGTHFAVAGGAHVDVLPATATLATRQTEAKAGTIKFDMRTAAGTETDPIIDDQVFLRFTVIRSLAGQR